MSSQELQTRDDIAIPLALKGTLMDTVFKGLTEPEAKISYMQAKHRGLDVISKQVFFVPYEDKNGKRTVVTQTSIDGFRVIAMKSGKYGGSINPKLTVRLKSGEKVVIPHEEYDPEEVSEIISGTISVINKDFPQPQTSTALFKSYAKTYNGKPMNLWATLGDVMILKCAEALCLRKAFPQDLSGLYTSDEMDQASNSEGISRVKGTVTPKETRTEPVKAEAEVVDVTPTAKVVEPQPSATPTPSEQPAVSITPTELWERLPGGLKQMNPLIEEEQIEAARILCLMKMNVDRIEDVPLEKADALRSYMRRGLKADMKKGGMWPEPPQEGEQL